MRVRSDFSAMRSRPSAIPRSACFESLPRDVARDVRIATRVPLPERRPSTATAFLGRLLRQRAWSGKSILMSRTALDAIGGSPRSATTSRRTISSASRCEKRASRSFCRRTRSTLPRRQVRARRMVPASPMGNDAQPARWTGLCRGASRKPSPVVRRRPRVLRRPTGLVLAAIALLGIRYAAEAASSGMGVTPLRWKNVLLLPLRDSILVGLFGPASWGAKRAGADDR